MIEAAQKHSKFWQLANTARKEIYAGDVVAAGVALQEAEALSQEHPFSASRRDILNALKEQLSTETETASPASVAAPSLDVLAGISYDAEPGISLVTCAMNRTENLIAALRTWIALPELSEIVIVDWSSDVPVAQSLREAGFSDPRIRVLRVEGEARWILSYAFNVGFRASRFSYILKTDADILLTPDFLGRNPLPSKAFISGNWRKAAEGQSHVNGFFFAHRADLAAVAGFNEFIDTYGWDDDDLYARLCENGVERLDVDLDTIYHQPHSDEERTGAGAVLAQNAFQELTSRTIYAIRRNRFIANVMPYWSHGKTHLGFEYTLSDNGETVLKRSGERPHYVPDHISADADYYALLELTSWDVGPEVLELERDALLRLLKKPLHEIEKDDIWNAQKPAPSQDPKAVSKPKAPSVLPDRPRLYIDAQHGLGNRLRAIGSAAAIAEASARELVIIWQPDSHCEARFSDLFEYSGTVIEEAFVDVAARQGCQVYNYMEIEKGAKKNAPLNLDWAGDIYARTAYVLNAPQSNWDAENAFLKALTPVKQVRDLVATVRQSNDVSAHVRMVGGAEYEHLPYEATDNWTEEGHKETGFWRRKSHFSHFIKRIDALIAEGRADRIFVAADKPETYDAFTETYGDRVAYLPRPVYDRSAEQLRYALADALLLGSAPLLLGSSWSSFSELAMRLSPHKAEIEMSGKDF